MFVVTETEVVDLPGERLEAELTTLVADLHSGMCRFLLRVAEFDRRALYESWECRGTSQWLTWKCGVAARPPASMCTWLGRWRSCLWRPPRSVVGSCRMRRCGPWL